MGDISIVTNDVILTCVIDQDINTAIFAGDVLVHFGNRVVVFNVYLDGLDNAGALGEFRLKILGRSVGLVEAPASQQDGVCFGRLQQRSYSFVAQPGVGPGDQDNWVGCHFQCSWLDARCSRK